MQGQRSELTQDSDKTHEVPAVSLSVPLFFAFLLHFQIIGEIGSHNASHIPARTQNRHKSLRVFPVKTQRVFSLSDLDKTVNSLTGCVEPHNPRNLIEDSYTTRVFQCSRTLLDEA